MTSDVRKLKCYFDPSEGFPIVSAVQVPTSGFIYLVCENPRSKHVNKLAVQNYDEEDLADYDYSNEVGKVHIMDTKYAKMLGDYPDFLLTNYEAVKNSYIMTSKIQMAAGIRFIIEQFVYQVVAKGASLSRGNMRTIGVNRCMDVFKNPNSKPEGERAELKLPFFEWIKGQKSGGKMPKDDYLKSIAEAYDITSDELHDSLNTIMELYEAFEATMNFLLEFYKLKNKWSDGDGS